MIETTARELYRHAVPQPWGFRLSKPETPRASAQTLHLRKLVRFGLGYKAL